VNPVVRHGCGDTAATAALVASIYQWQRYQLPSHVRRQLRSATDGLSALRCFRALSLSLSIPAADAGSLGRIRLLFAIVYTVHPICRAPSGTLCLMIFSRDVGLYTTTA